MKRSLLTGFAALAVAVLPVLAQASETSLPVNDVITAKGGSAPLLLWRTNNDVHTLRAQNVSDQQLLPALLSDGVLLMAARAKSLPDAKTMTIRLLFSNQGGVDPRYGLAVMAGIQRVATMTVPANDLRAGKADVLAHQLRSGIVPAPVKLAVEVKNFSPAPGQ